MSHFTLLFLVVYIAVCLTSVNARPQENQQVRPIDATSTRTELMKSNIENLETDVTLLRKKFGRLPGVCRRLKRRRKTILCNVGSYCSVLRSSQHGHICSCPKGSRCTHFFLKSF